MQVKRKYFQPVTIVLFVILIVTLAILFFQYKRISQKKQWTFEQQNHWAAILTKVQKLKFGIVAYTNNAYAFAISNNAKSIKEKEFGNLELNTTQAELSALTDTLLEEKNLSDSVKVSYPEILWSADSLIHLKQLAYPETGAYLYYVKRCELYASTAIRACTQLEQKAKYKYNELLTQYQALHDKHKVLMVWLQIIFLIIVALFIVKFFYDIEHLKEFFRLSRYIETIINRSNNAIISTNNLFLVETWNKGAEKIFGFLEADVKQKDAIDIVKSSWSFDERSQIENELKVTGYWQGESFERNKKGEAVVIFNSITALRDNNNKLEGFVNIKTDITESVKNKERLKRTEQKLSLLEKMSEITTDAVIITNQYLEIIDWNNGAEMMYGYTKTNVLTQPITRLFKTNFVSNQQQNFLQLLQQQHSWTGEVALTNNVGQTVYTLSSVTCIQNNNNEIEKVVFVNKDITNIKKSQQYLENFNAELEQKVAEKTTALNNLNLKLRNFTRDQEKTIEEERKYIAREIHDELGQQMTAIKFDVVALKRKLVQENSEHIDKVENIVSHIDDNMKTIRRLSLSLRPSIIDDLGLVAALNWQFNEFKRRTGLAVNFKSDIDDAHFSSHFKNSIYRICQEALTNIIRHAQATAINIELNYVFDVTEELVLIIQDNGKGFDSTKTFDSFGLISMQERAISVKAKLKIDSKINEGTTIVLTTDKKNVYENFTS